MGLLVILIWAVLWEITINKLNVYKTPTWVVVDKKKAERTPLEITEFKKSS